MKIIRDLTPLYLHLNLFIKFYKPHSTIQITSLFHITNSPTSLLSYLIMPPTTLLPCLKHPLSTLLPCLKITPLYPVTLSLTTPRLLCYHVSKRLHPPLLPCLKHPLSTLLPCLKPSPIYPVTLSLTNPVYSVTMSQTTPLYPVTLSPPLSYFFQFKIPIYATFALPLRIWRI